METVARQPDGLAPKREEIRRLHRKGMKPQEIQEKTGYNKRYIQHVLNKWEYGPGSKQAQMVQTTYEMMVEAIVILRQLSKLPKGEIRNRIASIDEAMLLRDFREPREQKPPPPKPAMTLDKLASLLSGKEAE